ncbi:MAG: CRTAC1 family protein [Deltaproteobacteria bacterium]|nr:CRTAC1 family protein [Deltaproteobacteria bacterium]
MTGCYRGVGMHHRTIAMALLLGFGWACSRQPLPPDYGGEALWASIDIGGAPDRGEPSGPVPESEQVEAGPITLVDTSAAAGLQGVVAGGNSHGVGVAFADLDGDDWADILVISGVSNANGQRFGSRLLRNRGDGTFEDATDTSGVGPILEGRDGYSVATGDLDGDGVVDLYVGAQPTDVFLRGRGDGTFEDVTASRGAGGPASDPGLVGNGSSKVVSLGDVDDDGDLDIVSASSTLPFPGVYLLRNDGGGSFTDITADSGVAIDPRGNPCAVLWSDYDNDGDRDLWIWNDRGGKVLLRNDGGRLTNVTREAGLDEVTINNPMGIDAADIDHDGDLDVYVSNIGNNPLLRNNGDGTFVDITNLAGTGGQYGWGLGFEDFDADGWADLFVAQEDDRPELVFHNLGQDPPAFEQLAFEHPPVVDSNVAHNVAVAFADYDHDGRTDVLTARTDGSPVVLYRNETILGTHGTLDIVVTPRPEDQPGGGVGARVAVATGDLIQFRDITAGSSRASQTEQTIRMGLGQYRGADWVAVLWPNGRQAAVRNVGAGQRLQLP